ncbi:MAG TPA: hypothetical protein PL041_03445 [Melioribacteraceae bacterium]|nr:hypothetical protein [Melioribacteraceae bacterium]
MNEIDKATNHLIKNDKQLSTIIKKFGKCNIQKHKDYLKAIIRSIIGQQLSINAANKISERFFLHFGTNINTAEIIATDNQILKGIGLSNSKINYIKDLCLNIENKTVSLKDINKKTDEQIILELIKVKGIGIWTVQMFLIFTLGRLNVLANTDLGIRKGIKMIYGFKELPTFEEVTEISRQNNWNPYNTIACIYIWKYLDNNTETF